MTHRVFFACVLFVLAWSNKTALAADITSGASLNSEVQHYVTAQLTKLPEYADRDVAVNVGQLDSRLQLKPCDVPLSKSIVSSRPYGANLSVKVACGGTNRWTIYVPTQLEQYAEVVVVSHPLRRGTILSTVDVALQKMNISQAGYGHISDINRAVGMQLQRNVQEGEALRFSHLKSPQIVKRGDRVMMEAGTASVSVVTTGKALSAGRLGDQVRVQNNKSERIIDAEVVAPGRVKVSL